MNDGLMQIFDQKLRSEGCQNIGIYANRSTMENIDANMRSTHNVALKDTNWKIWLAGGPQYENEATHEGHTLDDLVDIPNTINETSGFVADIRQVTNVATDTGASNENGFCDVNYLYTQDIFGNEVPAKEDLVDVMEIDLSNYVNISMHDALTIVNYLEELISKLSTITVICAIVGVGAHSITVAHITVMVLNLEIS